MTDPNQGVGVIIKIIETLGACKLYCNVKKSKRLVAPPAKDLQTLYEGEI